MSENPSEHYTPNPYKFGRDDFAKVSGTKKIGTVTSFHRQGNGTEIYSLNVDGEIKIYKGKELEIPTDEEKKRHGADIMRRVFGL